MQLYGWLFSELVFVLMLGADNPDFITKRDE